jgi:hypothetical protein
MKKLIPKIMMAGVLSLFFVGNLSAGNWVGPANGCKLFINETSAPATSAAIVANHELSNVEMAVRARAIVLMNRVYDIKAMDVSAMSASEKKALRKEVRNIRNEMNSINAVLANNSGGGVYISVGAIIIIILLILLL